MSTVSDDEGLGLRHLVVVDLSRTGAGAAAASTLAGLGATVIKVESPDRNGRSKIGDSRHAVFNAGKRSVALDLEDPAHREQLLGLIDHADAIVEDWGFGATDALGLGFADLRVRNPALVYAQLTAFNDRSRWAAAPINEGVAQAASGLASITGAADSAPLLAGFDFAATSAGLFAAMGVLTAIYQRHRTGDGQRVAVAAQEAITSLMRGPWGRGLRDGGRVSRSGNGFTDVAPMDVFACAPGGPDDYVYLWVGERDGAAGWHAMLRLLGRSDLEGDSRFETVSARAAHRTEVDELITAWTRERSKAEVMELAVRAGVICGAVQTTQDLASDEELWARGSMMSAITPEGRRIAMPGSPIRLSDCALPSGQVAALGEHNDDLLNPERLRAVTFGTKCQDPDDAGPPLSGIRVVDLTHAESGPFATEMLAVMGAEVIKIERPPDGEYMRHSSAFTVGKSAGTAPAFGLLNANKKSVVIDLKSSTNLDSLRQMIRDADVIVENFFPGAVERMGLGYEELHALNPRLIYAQLTGYPSGTVRARYPSFDMVGQASGGLMAVTGYVGGPPHRVGAHVADSGAGLHLAIGIIGALNQRAITGRGQRIEVSMQESAMNYARSAFARHADAGGPPARKGSRAPVGVTAAGMYACAGGGPDDYCYIELGETDDAWTELAGAIGRQDLVSEARFRDAEARSRHSDELDELIGGWTRSLDKVDVMDQMIAAGVPASAVFSVADLITRPEYWEQGALAKFVIAPGVELPMLNVPVRMSGATVAPYWLAEAGAHNAWFEAEVGRPIEIPQAAEKSTSQSSLRFSVS